MEVENPEELARGELQRGDRPAKPREMTYLGWLWIAYGFTRQKQHVFLATGLTQTEKDPDAEEHDLIVRSVAVEEFEEMMLQRHDSRQLHAGGVGALSAVEGAAVAACY